MKLLMVTIYDSKAELHSKPLFFQARGQALRAFTDAVNDDDPKNEYHRHAADYTLFLIGHFDDNTAAIVTEPAPVNLGNGLEFLNQEQ